MIIKDFTISILLLYISIFDIVGAVHHGRIRLARSSSHRADYGQVNFYVRESCDDGPRSRYTKIPFPYVRQNSQQMFSFGSLVRVSQWTPIYVDRYTRHTFIRTLYGIYVIPPMINHFGRPISVGHLIVNGYVTVYHNGLPITSYFDITSFIHPGSYRQSDAPKYNQRLRRFNDGVHTNYRSDFKQHCKSKYQDIKGGDYNEGKYPNKPDYYQRPYRPYSKNKIDKTSSITKPSTTTTTTTVDIYDTSLSNVNVQLLNVEETEFNDPNANISFQFSPPILNISSYAVFIGNTPVTNTMNTTGSITILQNGFTDRISVSLVAQDQLGFSIFRSYDLYFGTFSMLVTVYYSNENVAPNVLIYANLTDNPSVSQSGYTDQNGEITFHNVPSRTLTFFARIDNFVAIQGTVGASSNVILVLIPFGENINATIASFSNVKLVNSFKEYPRETFKKNIRRKRNTEIEGFSVTTEGQQLQMVSRTLMTENNSTIAYVRYKFITEEIPAGFFGSIWNDYFTIIIRSEQKDLASISQSMNGMGLGAFNHTTGETDWYTLKLNILGGPQSVQINVGVSNVGDSSFQSTVVVDKIGIENCQKCDNCTVCTSNSMCRDTCLNPPEDSCLFYTDCMEDKISCGSDGYALKYGRKICLNYFNRLNLFSAQGQTWIKKTMNCLQKALVIPLINCNSTCASLEDIGYNSQSTCYFNWGLCDLQWQDWIEIFTIVMKISPVSKNIIDGLKTNEVCLDHMIATLQSNTNGTDTIPNKKISTTLHFLQSIKNPT